MAALSVPTRFFLGIPLIYLLQVPAPCLAQQAMRDPNDLTYADDQNRIQAAKGCSHAALFPQMPMSVEESCTQGDSVEVILPLRPNANGTAHEKRVRGAYEFHEYKIRNADQEYAFDNLMGLAPMAGFVVKYSVKPSIITAQKDDTWVLINVAGESYNISLVRAGETPWTPITTAAEISREMQAHNRADIYGIQFSSAGQSIQESQSPILVEVLKYLNKNPDLSVVIESHKVSKTGPPEDDSEITRERANAVMDWLLAHGIARARLQPRPFGRDNPLTENETPSEIQRNDRIVLAKAKTLGNQTPKSGAP